MMFPLVQELAAEGVPVRLTCGVLGFSPQAFYKWQSRPCSTRDWVDAHLTNAIIDVHDGDPEFGYRFVTDELHAAGHRVGERRVWRLCRMQRVWSTTTKKGRRHHKTPGPAVHDDLVQRDFSAPALNVVWLTDITEHRTLEGKLYCCAIKDCFSNRIVGYALADRMTAELAVSALRSAIARRQPRGTVVVHSDRGSQFRSRAFRAVLRAHGLTGSMGRVASAGDNAAMESFFSLLQKNVLNRRRWRTRAELRHATVYWIEHTYNRRRRQRALGKLTPIEFELTFAPQPDRADINDAA
jgi:putative transposase